MSLKSHNMKSSHKSKNSNLTKDLDDEEEFKNEAIWKWLLKNKKSKEVQGGGKTT